MDDLITRLTAAIDVTERVARLVASRNGHRPWSLAASATIDPGGEDGIGDLFGVGDSRIAQHVVRHDPDNVLRGCAADRKILARHQEKTGCRNLHGDGEPHRPDCFDCTYCDGQYWPCPDLLDLAERYGLEADGG